MTAKNFENAEQMIPEITEMLANIEKIKGERYGMILSTLFNLHNMCQVTLRLLETNTSLPANQLNDIQRINELIVGHALLSMFRLYYHQQQPSQEELNLATTGMDNDLRMLLLKQHEYDEKE